MPTQESERLQQIAQFYTDETENYDDGYGTIVCQAEDFIVGEILKNVLTGKVLDIGAGSGLLCGIADIDEYTGIELSEKMLRQATEKYPNKDFAVADMHKLPFADNHFDSAVSLYGPPSYSLYPEELRAEIIRVVKPGGYIALMPYSLRVQHKLALGGYSTATEDSIQKIFYSEEMLRKLLNPLENLNIFGINYFLNVTQDFAQIVGNGMIHDLDSCVDFLHTEQVLAKNLPAELARHMIAIGQKPK